jgi:hypothetical protein
MAEHETKPNHYIPVANVAGPSNVEIIGRLVENGKLNAGRFFWQGDLLFVDPDYSEKIRSVLVKRLGAGALLDIVS